jgi:3-oxoacyl-[acyl-carrier protein] reductase
MNTLSPIDGRAVLVTGASGGIGVAIARALHRDGATVVAHYGRDRSAAERLAAELGDRVHVVQGDLTKPNAAAAVWGHAISLAGRIDVLVNNAGAWIESPIDDAEKWEAGWTTNLMLNLAAPADLCRLALMHYRTVGGGVIVNMCSRSAHRGDDAQHLAYGAAKGGLLALTRGIARGYAHDGVLACAIAPGWVATDLAPGKDLDEITTALPLRELTPPEDVAEMVAFLASGRSRHTTGATIDINGADYVR